MNIEKIALLRKVPLFSALNDVELAELASLTRERRLATGESVFWEGAPAEWFYLIAEGRIKVAKLSSTGKEIILSFFGSGEMFGEVAVFENQPYPASALAVEQTRLLVLRKEHFSALLLKYPSLGMRVIAVLSGRLRDAQNRLRDLAGERVEQRLARLLLSLSERLGPTLTFTRQELSDMAGTTTETAIRITSQWKERGLITTERGAITIADPVKLRLLADGPPAV